MHNSGYISATERPLRGVALERSNWTFFGSGKGGETAAVLRSLVNLREPASVDPFAWFKDVLGHIVDLPMKRLDKLLLQRWDEAARQA